MLRSGLSLRSRGLWRWGLGRGKALRLSMGGTGGGGLGLRLCLSRGLRHRLRAGGSLGVRCGSLGLLPRRRRGLLSSGRQGLRLVLGLRGQGVGNGCGLGGKLRLCRELRRRRCLRLRSELVLGAGGGRRPAGSGGLSLRVGGGLRRGGGPSRGGTLRGGALRGGGGLRRSWRRRLCRGGL